jgi:hypothetical protein
MRKINGICPKCNYQICKCRDLEYEKKFRAYLFKGDLERHKEICKNINVEFKEAK